MILRRRLRVSAQHTVLLTNAVITLAVVACSSEPRAIKEERRHSQTEGSVGVVVEDIVPVLGGDAYAVGLPSGLWHLTKSTATRVHAVGDSATRVRFASVVPLEIQPTTDGGAYAFSPVWRYLALGCRLGCRSDAEPGEECCGHSDNASASGDRLGPVRARTQEA